MPKLTALKEFYSEELCRLNPNTLFVFGDNLICKGKGGQAIIRSEPNTLGIATKALPYTHKRSFFDDNNPSHYKYLLEDIARLQYHLHIHSEYNQIVLPYAGLGTGLSEMPQRAPKLFKLLTKLVYKDNDLPYEHLLELLKD